MKNKIAGFGIVSPLGDKNAVWEVLCGERKQKLSFQKRDNINICISGISTDNNRINPKYYRRMDKQVIYELMAGDQAINDFVDYKMIDNSRVGVFTGSLFAQLEFGMEQIKSLIFSGMRNNISMYTGISFYYGAASGEMSLMIKSKGENASICNGACSGIDCTIEGMKNIEREINELVISIAGENLSGDVVADMLPYSIKMDKLLNPKSYFYTSGAACVLVGNVNKVVSPIEIVAYDNSCDYESLFQCGEKYVEVIKKSIYKCLDEANISSEDIDLIIPGFNNMGDYDNAEMHVLYEIFHNKERILYTPIPQIGDCLSASGNIKIYVAYQSMREGILLANEDSWFVKRSIDLYKALFNWERTKKDIKYSLIIQRDIIGGRISMLIMKNTQI